MPASIELEPALAILGLRAGCSYSAAVLRYRRIVKRWHPDQFANEPVRQAEACQRMQDINRAFEVVKQAIGNQYQSPPHTFGPTHIPPSAAPTKFGQRLTEAELDEISRSIGRPGTFEAASRYFGWGGAIVGAVLLLGYGGGMGGRSPRAIEVVVAVLLLCAAGVSIGRAIRRWGSMYPSPRA
jgi:hypothetical protein